MAKQLVNPIERHVEKAVLGVAALILLAVIAKYLVSSPNQLELGGETIDPGSVDQKVAQLAANVREHIKRATPNAESPEPLYDTYVATLDPFKREGLALSLPRSAPIGPEVPIVDLPESKADQAELVRVVSNRQLEETHGRSTFVTLTQDGDERHRPANWVTVSAVFDVKGQMAEQRRTYGAARKEVLFGPAQLQRRVRRPDGSWSDDDWKIVTPWPPVALPTLPEIELTQEEGQIVLSEDDQADVERFFEELTDPMLQLSLLRPLSLDVANGTEWSFPILTSYRDVLDQDDQYLYPDDPPSAAPDDRYQVESGRGDAGPQLPRDKERRQEFAEIERLLEAAWETKNVNLAITAHNMAAKIKEQDATASAADKEKATKIKERANQVEADIDRWNLTHGRGSRDAGSGSGLSPDVGEGRQPLPTQQIWAHDTEPGSVEGGKTYQYRLRPTIFNRLVGEPDKFRDPRDATVLWVPGQWTKPVEITVEPTTVFFVTSKDTRKHQVAVEFYRWFEGVWVKAKRFKFGVGEAIRGQDRCEVPSIHDSTKADRALVEFEAGASVVDVDFDRPYRDRKKGASRTGVKFGSPSTACSAILVDAAGHLQERFVPTEKGHPAKRQYASRVWQKPKSSD